jgi:four helix bundle protein
MEENLKINTFTDLRVWKESHALVLLTYKSTKVFPKDELFGLTSQMRRTAVSVTSNIAEGFARLGRKEKIQFYSIARGSLVELENQFIIARDVGYISEDEWKIIAGQIVPVHQLLNAFIRSTRNF